MLYVTTFYFFFINFLWYNLDGVMFVFMCNKYNDSDGALLRSFLSWRFALRTHKLLRSVRNLWFLSEEQFLKADYVGVIFKSK